MKSKLQAHPAAEGHSPAPRRASRASAGETARKVEKAAKPGKQAAPATEAKALKVGRAATAPAPAASAPSGRRIQVRRSGVHGKGVFAVRPIQRGEVLIEYVGERITWEEALDRHPHDPAQPDHTFYFHVDDGHVIDANVGGNASRWINHACTPNCEADEVDGRIFIKARRALKAGEELFYDYGLVIDERYTPALKKRFECRCGTKGCRGTMLSPKR